MFDVDIEEGARPLKLPFNVTDDPWMEAQRFIHKHDLSQYYLEEVANFIIKNTKGVTLQAPSSNYQDPFTGTWSHCQEFSLGQSVGGRGNLQLKLFCKFRPQGKTFARQNSCLGGKFLCLIL